MLGGPPPRESVFDYFQGTDTGTTRAPIAASVRRWEKGAVSQTEKPGKRRLNKPLPCLNETPGNSPGVAALHTRAGAHSAGLPESQTNKNKDMKKLVTTMSALALATTLSLAQDKPPGGPGPGPGGPGGPGSGRPNPEEVFKKLDTNNDGSLSLDEFKASPRAQKEPDKAEAAFKKMDKDNDGKLTLEEFKAGRPPRGEGGPGRPPGGGGPGGPGGGGPPPGGPAPK